MSSEGAGDEAAEGIPPSNKGPASTFTHEVFGVSQKQLWQASRYVLRQRPRKVVWKQQQPFSQIRTPDRRLSRKSQWADSAAGVFANVILRLPQSRKTHAWSCCGEQAISVAC